ncbi:MAG: hypothetical protein JWM74_5863, partial [Myxococcaceae bacterium]|nr:hypothetical protein [Myxococcaceae bacterium]
MMLGVFAILAVTLVACVAIVRAMVRDLGQPDPPPLPPIDVTALAGPITVPGIFPRKAAIWLVPTIVGLFGLMEAHGAWKALFAVVGVVGLLVVVAFGSNQPPALVFDADGVAISTSRGVERFRFEQVASVDLVEYVFTLRLVDGSTRSCRLFAHEASVIKVRAIEALLHRSREPSVSPRGRTRAPAPSVEPPGEGLPEAVEHETFAEPTTPAIPGSQFRLTGPSAIALAAAVVAATVMIVEASVRLPLGVCVAGSLVAALAFGFVTPPALSFGEDGVVIGGADRKEFLPYSTIDSIRYDRGDAIIFTDGK